MLDGKVVVGITQGDCNGIGSEVLIRSLQDPMFTEQFVPVIYGSGRVLAYYRKNLNIQGLQVFAIKSAAEVHPRRINLIEIATPEPVMVEMGQPTKNAGLLSLYGRLESGSCRCVGNSPRKQKFDTVGKFRLPGAYRIPCTSHAVRFGTDADD